MSKCKSCGLSFKDEIKMMHDQDECALAMEDKKELFDVVVFEMDSMKISNIVGTAMKRDSGYCNAEKRLVTMMCRMNNKYNAEIVPTGKYKVGDILKFAELKKKE